MTRFNNNINYNYIQMCLLLQYLRNCCILHHLCYPYAETKYEYQCLMISVFYQYCINVDYLNYHTVHWILLIRIVIRIYLCWLVDLIKDSMGTKCAFTIIMRYIDLYFLRSHVDTFRIISNQRLSYLWDTLW